MYERVNVHVIVSRHSGYGGLILSTEGAYRMDLSCKCATINNLRGEYLLQYKPQEPGIYLLNIKYGDDHVAGTTSTASHVARLLFCCCSRHNDARVVIISNLALTSSSIYSRRNTLWAFTSSVIAFQSHARTKEIFAP